MSFAKPNAKPLTPLACIGTVKVLTKRDDGSLALYRKPGGVDKAGNPLLVMGLEFTKAEGTTCPKDTYTYYASVSPFIFDPLTSGKDLEECPSYQKDNYSQHFKSSNGKSALFEHLFTEEELTSIFKDLEGMAEFKHTEDGIVDNTDWQKIAAYLNAAFGDRIVGFTLTQKVENKATGEVNPETGKAIWEKTLLDFYELNPKLYFTFDGPKTKIRKGHRETFPLELPF